MTDSKCDQLFKEKKYSELLEYCQFKLSASPENAEYLFYEATAFAASGNTRKAETLFTKLFSKTGKYIYLACRGLVRFLAGNVIGAKKDLREAIENDENYEDLIFVFRVANKYYDSEDANAAMGKAMAIDRTAALGEMESFVEELSKNSSQSERMLLAAIMRLLKVAVED
jgi:tetratricopeptide (TPR) repeat protein